MILFDYLVKTGEQLEGVNMPRSRAVEAQQLIRYFAEFTSTTNSGPTSAIFLDPNQLQPAADVIQKLHMIAQVCGFGLVYETGCTRQPLVACMRVG